MSTATFVKDVSKKFLGEARLYSIEGGHVVASSVAGPFARETMVFPADENGEVIDWRELGVAYPDGEFDAALEASGFTVE